MGNEMWKVSAREKLSELLGMEKMRWIIRAQSKVYKGYLRDRPVDA